MACNFIYSFYIPFLKDNLKIKKKTKKQIGFLKSYPALLLSPHPTGYVSTSARFSTPVCRFCKETPLLYGNCSIVHPHPTNPSGRPTPPPSLRSPIVPPPLPRSPFVLASTPLTSRHPRYISWSLPRAAAAPAGPPPSFLRVWIRTPRHVGAQGGDNRFTRVNQLEQLECSSPSSSPSPFPVLRVADTRDEGTARWWQSLSLSLSQF
jgi:hypothetical protein